MNKAELLTDLEAQTDIVSILYKQNILNGDSEVITNGSKTQLIVDYTDNLTVYNVPVLKAHPSDPEVWNKAVQPISVLNDGEIDGSEEARYHTNKNFTEDIITFRDEVQTRADSFEGVVLGQGTAEERTIVKVTLQQTFEDRKAATAVAFCNDGSQIKALLYKDGNDDWKTQILN